jgi:carbamoyltransferase
MLISLPYSPPAGRIGASLVVKLNVPHSDIPPVTHVDYSARTQTVREDTNPRYHGLLTEFERKTGCPVL